MKTPLILLILVSVMLSAGSQVLLKYGMTSTVIKTAMEDKRPPLQIALTIATNPAVLTGLFCFGLSAVAWLFVLARIPLSSAYPFVALGIAVTVIAGRYLFDEPISLAKLVGVTLILAGITTLATSS